MGSRRLGTILAILGFFVLPGCKTQPLSKAKSQPQIITDPGPSPASFSSPSPSTSPKPSQSPVVSPNPSTSPTPSPTPSTVPVLVFPPVPPSAFTAIPMAGGAIQLNLVYPELLWVAEYAQLEIRVAMGGIPPSCQDGTVVSLAYPPLFPSTVIYETGFTNGEMVSFRLCVSNKFGLLSSVFIAGISVVDTLPPTGPAFQASPGTVPGTISLTLTLPGSEDIKEYSQLEIRREIGKVPPACQGGVIVFSQTSGFKSTVVVDETGATASQEFSYRVCVTDSSKNTTSATATAITQSKCSGKLIDGFCYSISLSGEDCYRTCLRQGKVVDLVGTQYANADQCGRILGEVTQSNIRGEISLFGSRVGCSLDASNNAVHWTILGFSTDADSQLFGYERLCACKM